MAKRMVIVCDSCEVDMTDRDQRWGQSLASPDGRQFYFHFCSDGCYVEWKREHEEAKAP